MLFDDIIFPGVLVDKWQMMPWERIALTGLLSRLKPKGALEIGVYYGGSLSLTAPFVDEGIAIDIDPEVSQRFQPPSNVNIWIGDSSTLIPKAVQYFSQPGKELNFVLIDADHSADGVRRDIELLLAIEVRAPLVVAMHDSGNPETRAGILSADWGRNPHCHFVDLDFVPGQIIENSVSHGRAEVWGGLGLAYFDHNRRTGPVQIVESARTSIRCLHHCASDLSILD